MYCDTSTHHSIVPSLVDVALITVVYLNRQEYGWDGTDEGTPVEEYAQDRQDDG